MKRAAHVLRLIIQVVAFAFFAIVGGCAFLVEIPMTLAVGWAHFLRTISHHVTVNHTMMWVGLVILPILAVGTHCFLLWLSAQDKASDAGSAPPQPWRWAWSLSMLTVFLLMFVTGIAVFGMLHQVHWLFTDPQFFLHDAAAGPPGHRTRVHMKLVGRDLSNCLNEQRSLPTHSESVRLQAVQFPESCRPGYVRDEWGAPIMYTSNGRSYVLTSYGRNKVPGGGAGKFDDYVFADGKFFVPADE